VDPAGEAPSPSSPFRLGEWTVEPMLNTVSRGGQSVHVRRQLIDLLVCLASRPGQVVPKEEIFKAVWPGQFVAETGLARCISQLRDVFGDDPRDPQVIETIPTRGYRLLLRAERVAPAGAGVVPQPVPGGPADDREPADEGSAGRPPGPPDTPLTPDRLATSRQPPAATGSRSLLRRPLVLAAAAVLLVAAATAAFLAWHAGPGSPLGRPDTLLVSFDNRSGEPVFDDTLRLALAIQLEQSPSLRVVPEPRIREELAFMQRSPDEPLTRALAMDLCARVGARAVLTGTLTRPGAYLIGVEGAECPSGRALVRRQVEVARREDVVAGLGRVASEIRRTLGESVASVQRHDVPLVRATTASLDALKALSAGDAARNRGRDVEALEAYRRAIDLDPQFALAHGRLGVLLLSLTRTGEATSALRRAFELRDRTSAGERQFITSYYYRRVVRDPFQAVSALEAWRDAYPRNAAARVSLAELYIAVGRFEDALTEGREALRVEPHSATATSAVVDALTSLERLDEAKRVAESEIAAGRGGVTMRLSLLQIAFLQGDADGMRRQVEWASANPAAESLFATHRASTAMAGGALKRGDELWRQRVAKAEERGDHALAALTTAGAAIHEALVGALDQAKMLTATALERPGTPDTVLRSAFALAVIGETDAADARFTQYLAMPDVEAGSDPQYRAPTQALIAIARNRPDAAIELLAPLQPYEVGLACVPTYVRGLAYLAAKRPGEAAAQFSFITAHRAALGNALIYPVAWLQLARAHAAAKDPAAARAAYARFPRSVEERRPPRAGAPPGPGRACRARPVTAGPHRTW
jgi:eukaryotic-like serine/threonine-protein kinase